MTMTRHVRTIPILMFVAAAAAVTATPRAASATPEADAARADIQKTFGFVPGFMKLVPDLALPGAWGTRHRMQSARSSAHDATPASRNRHPAATFAAERQVARSWSAGRSSTRGVKVCRRATTRGSRKFPRCGRCWFVPRSSTRGTSTPCCSRWTG